MKPNDFSQFPVLTEADFSSRSQLREDRHPNSVTAPPINRGSMTPRPWRGFWNSIGTALLVKLGAGGKAAAASSRAPQATQAWQRAAQQRRLAFMALTLLSTVIASMLFARAQQFASRVTGRLFTLGMQFWQLGESHYWGHNAIIRVEPFMQHCALAPIKGTGGMSGGIMSHDFVEAALMRRAGYHVWLVADLVGSYEQQPPDLLAELQRDRRWCQGNLQNARLMAEPGLHPVHRAMFVTGTMAYASAPLWLAFLTLGTALWLTGSSAVAHWLAMPMELAGLWLWTLCLLFLPRILGIAAVVMRREQRQYGGVGGLLKSAALESALAIVQAPVRMLAHSLFVVVALTGIKLEWKSPPREAAAVPWRIAFTQLAPMTGVIAALAVGIALIDASALTWLMPVGLPLLLAIPLTVMTSQIALGNAMRDRGFLVIPEESRSPAVLRRAWMHAVRLARA